MNESANPALDDAEREIRRLAQEAFDELVARIRAGEVSRDVIAEIQARFGDRFNGALASAFTEVLGRSISSADVAALPIGQVSLSRRLYENSIEVSSQVRRVIERHAMGMRDARKLALDIFEGYGFQGGRDPLKVRAGLPKYLKELLADRELGAPLEQLYRRINASVVRTQPLKAAYLQAVDSVLDQFGGLRLEKALNVAQFERNRYFANRIAQTELHRAHTDRMAGEILADGELEVVQIVLSSTHPRTDICDMHARIDKFGLGPGCYPKALAPKPPFHPFCRCLLRKRFDLSATGARERGGAERAFLRDHPEPARVMGSRQKVADVLGGSTVAAALNAGRDPLYHLAMVGDKIRKNVGESNGLPSPDALPNHEAAVIQKAKLYGYALNPDHEVGRHKAAFFASALGITRDNAELLDEAIRSGIRSAKAIKKHADSHGQRYEVDITVTGPAGSAIVRTGWIVQKEGDAPRMISAYVKEKLR